MSVLRLAFCGQMLLLPGDALCHSSSSQSTGPAVESKRTVTLKKPMNVAIAEVLGLKVEMFGRQVVIRL